MDYGQEIANSFFLPSFHKLHSNERRHSYREQVTKRRVASVMKLNHFTSQIPKKSQKDLSSRLVTSRKIPNFKYRPFSRSKCTKRREKSLPQPPKSDSQEKKPSSKELQLKSFDLSIKENLPKRNYFHTKSAAKNKVPKKPFKKLVRPNIPELQIVSTNKLKTDYKLT